MSPPRGQPEPPVDGQVGEPEGRPSAVLETRLRGLASPRRRRSPLLAGLAILASAWLLWDLSTDLSYFLSPAAPIDLGDVRTFRLGEARANRFVRISGPLVGAVAGTASGGEQRRVSGIFGTNLAVDRHAGASPTTIHEGRLLPAARRATYEPFVAQLRRQGWSVGERWMILREGERPRSAWGKPVLAVFLVGLAVFNVRSLVRHFAA